MSMFAFAILMQIIFYSCKSDEIQNQDDSSIWVKHPNPVLSRSAVYPNWKGLSTSDACVIKDNDTLKMWFAGNGWMSTSDVCPHVRIGYAWSLDGIHWNEHLNNPVLDRSTNPNNFDSDGVETPTVVKDLNASPDKRYKLWYAGRQLNCSSVQDHKIGYAYSPDGINWTKNSENPVLAPGNSSQWYNTAVYGPSVVLENGSYKMWFTTQDAVINNQSTDGKGNIGFATSIDGINWNIHPTPVVAADTQDNWDKAVCGEPSVVKIGNTYHMFYSVLNQFDVENFQIGYATSSNGIDWIKSINNPVITNGEVGQWDSYWASHPTFIYDSDTNKFKVWYTGRNQETITSVSGYYWDIGYAEKYVIY